VLPPTRILRLNGVMIALGGFAWFCSAALLAHFLYSMTVRRRRTPTVEQSLRHADRLAVVGILGALAAVVYIVAAPGSNDVMLVPLLFCAVSAGHDFAIYRVLRAAAGQPMTWSDRAW
jgi:hypothetical protein